jgi:hypothetical protein
MSFLQLTLIEEKPLCHYLLFLLFTPKQTLNQRFFLSHFSQLQKVFHQPATAADNNKSLLFLPLSDINTRTE